MIGELFAGRYELIREVGRGGMGIVYLSRDTLLDRSVAVKLIGHRNFGDDAVERFRREARVAAKMDHPSIVGLHDFGQHGDYLFFVMPYVQGHSLRALMRERPLQLGEILEIGIQIAEALEYSHDLGVIHRDIKPENILVSRLGDGNLRARLTDFGLARASFEGRITQSGQLMGTPFYWSPEQLSAHSVDARSDIYSLATVLYECICGEPPFTGELQHLLYQITNQPAPSLRSRSIEVDENLDRIILQCLEKNPEKRPGRVRELADSMAGYRREVLENRQQQRLAEPVERPARPPSAALIDRNEELLLLRNRIENAAAGESQLAVIAGELGMGKSRLMEEVELLARPRQFRILHGRFVEEGKAFHYHGFCEAFQEYFRQYWPLDSAAGDAFKELAPELVTLFPMLTELEALRWTTTTSSRLSGPAAELHFENQTWIFELLAITFGRMAAGRPLLVLLQDLHHADVSVDALEYIVRRLGPSPVCFIVTYRSEEVGSNHPLVRLIRNFQGDKRFCLIQLKPFSPAAHREFISAITNSRAWPEEVVGKLYSATEGNPYFTQELIRALMDSGNLAQDQCGHWNLSGDEADLAGILPATVQDAVKQRVERLPESYTRLLALASVIGRSFELADLLFLCENKAEVEEVLDQLLQDGFLIEERTSRADRFSFESGVLREVIYASLPRRQRRLLHRTFAGYLESRNQGRLERVYPQLVHHYEQGGIPEKVLEFGMHWARKSLTAFSPEDAIRALRSVLKVLDDGSEDRPPRIWEARNLLAAAYRMMDHKAAIINELEAAIEAGIGCIDQSMLAAKALEIAEVAWAARRMEHALRWIERGLELARPGNQHELMVRLLSMGAAIENLRGNYDRSQIYLLEAARLGGFPEEGPEDLAPGGELQVALTSPATATRPSEIRLDEESEILANVYETLIRPDPHGHPVSLLAENWQSLEAGRRFLFKLKKNIRWHDGTELCALDVKVSIEEALRHNRAYTPTAYSSIEGLEEFRNGSRDELSGLKVLDRETIEITLVDPLPIYPSLMTDLKTALMKSGTRDGNAVCLGTGPFRLARFSPGETRLERHSGYWGGAPPLLDAILFRSGVPSATIAREFREGRVDLARDLLPEDLDELLLDQKLRPGIVSVLKKNVYFVLLSPFSSSLTAPETRKALLGVVPVPDLVRRSLGRFAQPASCFLPPGILGHEPVRRISLVTSEQATRSIQQAGLELPLRLRAAIHPVMLDRYAALTQNLLRIWTGLGIEVHNATPTMESFLAADRNEEQYDLTIGRYIADFDDPDTFTYTLFNSQTGYLRKFYHSPELDQTMMAARSASSPDERVRHYRRFEKHLAERNILLPLCHDMDYRVASTKVRRLILNSVPPYANYHSLAKAETSPGQPSGLERSGVVQVPLSGTIRYLDPAKILLVLEAEVCQAVFENLTKEGQGAAVMPHLARKLEAEAGGRRFRFQLREDVRFHDGRHLTARDVKYSLERLLRDSASESRWLLSPIQGADELIRGERDHLTGFHTLSPYEFSIELREPVGFFPALVGHYAAAIVPEGTMVMGRSWEEGCVGTGPFRVVRYDPGNRLVLEANPYYWQPGVPLCQRIVFNFGISPEEMVAGFRSGRYSLAWDLPPAEVEELRRDFRFGARFQEMPSLSTYLIIFNTKDGPMADQQLRQLLVSQLNVEEMVEASCGRTALPARGLIPPGLLGYEQRERTPKNTPPGSVNFNQLTLTCQIHRIYEGPWAAFTKTLLNVFQRLGIRLEITPVRADMPESRYAPADLYLTRWIADYPDADTFAHGLIHSEKGYMGHRCGSPETDVLIEQGRRETDPDERHHIYCRLEEAITRQASLLPLFHEQACRFARPELEDFKITFSGPHVVYEKLKFTGRS